MTEWVTYGSVGGAAGNSRSYPELDSCAPRATVSNASEHTLSATTSYGGCYTY